MMGQLSFLETTPTGWYGDISICLSMVIHVDREPKDLHQTCSPVMSTYVINLVLGSEYIALQQHLCLTASSGHSKPGPMILGKSYKLSLVSADLLTHIE